MTFLSITAAIATNNGLVGRIQRDAVQVLLDGDERRRSLERMRVGERHALVSPEGILLGWKLALLYADKSRSAPGDPLSVGRLLLGTNQMTGHGRLATGAGAAVMRSQVLRTDIVGDWIARELLLLHDYEQALEPGLRYDIEGRFRALTGIDAVDYVACAMAFYATYAQYRQARQVVLPGFDTAPAALLARTSRPDVVETFLKLVSRTTEDATRDLLTCRR
jgi:hypothetical protein